jgi:hypothetical protein
LSNEPSAFLLLEGSLFLVTIFSVPIRAENLIRSCVEKDALLRPVFMMRTRFPYFFLAHVLRLEREAKRSKERKEKRKDVRAGRHDAPPVQRTPVTLTIAAATHQSEDFVLSDEIAIDINPSTCSIAAFVNCESEIELLDENQE